MNKKFSVIVVDPPWGGFSDKLTMSSTKRGAAANYPTMTTEQLCSLPVKNIADPNGCVLALWVIGSMLEDGLRVMKSWGFSQKQNWIWVKLKKDPFQHLQNKKPINWDDFLSFGMGRLGRNVHEMVLIGTLGKVYKNLKNKSQRTVFFSQNEKHSKKPEILQDKLEIMFPNANYLELFGRRLRNNWTVIGNQSPLTMGENIELSINNLNK